VTWEDLCILSRTVDSSSVQCPKVCQVTEKARAAKEEEEALLDRRKEAGPKKANATKEGKGHAREAVQQYTACSSSAGVVEWVRRYTEAAGVACCL
jgi:hypothetical protein